MIAFPNCKINLGLYITKRRHDGYHDLETVFYPLPWNDVLEGVPAAAPSLQLTGIAVAGDPENNLVWKAWKLLHAAFPDRVAPLAMHLHKVIPMGAGLGGGSANGAFMLRLIHDYFGLELTDAALAALALKLGSDCPFFIYNTPQFAQGRGEKLQAIPLDLSRYSIQVICPGVHVSTAAAFKMIAPKPAPFDLRQLSALPLSEWKERLSNDFEAPVFAQHPELAAIKENLYEAGALYASMSGSGSAVYGIFEKGTKAAIDGEYCYLD